MSFLDDFLARRGIDAIDGRPLHAYRPTEDELARLQPLVRNAVTNVMTQGQPGSTQAGPSARLFVLWAAEHIRRQYQKGILSWDFVFSALGLTYDLSAVHALTQTGLELWQRPLRRRLPDGSRMYLYSLMAEGGLPDAMLARGSGYQAAVLTLVAALERDRIRDHAAALAIAKRAVNHLPSVFANAETVQLLAELGLAISALRDGLPAGLEAEAQEIWLDRNRSGWADTLPLHLSDASREAILRPALRLVDAPGPGDEIPVQRLLRRRTDGAGWLGMVQLAAGGTLPAGLAPFAPPGKILRLTSEQGLVMRASPETDRTGEASWRLDPIGNSLAALKPTEALVFTVNLDGRALGEVVLDHGMAAPELSPGIWAPDSGGESLRPRVRPRCRAAHLWLLAPEGIVPRPEAGVSLLGDELAPEGRLWQLEGRGRIILGDRSIEIATGADEPDGEGDVPRMIATGRLLPQWRAKPRLPVYLGRLRILGAYPGAGLRELGRQVRETPMRRLLGGTLARWVSSEETLAVLECISLPEAFAVRLRATRPGEIEAEVTGIPLGWEVSFAAGGKRVAAQRQGAAWTAQLNSGGCSAGEIEMAVFDPASGRRLELVRIWPARDPVLVSPAGERLSTHRQLALSSIAGWRGQLPEQGGAIQLRIARDGPPVAFPAGGQVRLASLGGVFGQALAMTGADGRVNLRLIAGTETPRLAIGRYDWETNSDRSVLAETPCRLTALTTSPPHELRVVDTDPSFSLDSWLGDRDAVWLVQGHSDKGVLRAFPWSRRPQPRSTREQRIDSYVKWMRGLLRKPAAEGWDHFTRLLALGREGGDCGALDQVQALAEAPAFALALLLRSPDPPAILELETETPLWWPLTRLADWRAAVLHLRDWQLGPLEASGFASTEARGLVLQGLSRRLGRIVELRPELAGHVARTLADLDLPKRVTGASGEAITLEVANPAELLHAAARRLVARDPQMPHGSGRLMPQRLVPPQGFHPAVTPLLVAPLVAAEAVTGLRRPLAPQEVLDLLALRFADPDGFDEALPLAVMAAPSPSKNHT